MKKTFLLVFALLFSGVGFAQKGQQTIGLQLGGIISATIIDGYDYNRPVPSPLAGIFYDWNFSRRMGVSTAVHFRNNYAKQYCIICLPEDDDDVWISTSYLEMPVNFALNLDSKETAKWKTYFLLGYTFSRTLTDKEGYNFELDNHYLNAGFEVRHTFNEKYNLALSPDFRALILETLDAGYFGFNLKVGRNL
jgi:hypothetical protein